ncbi:putative conserved protein, contains double-stranded beta-helix domain, partial [Dysosmobacter welbionis]
EEIRALVSLATTSPTAKRTITTANHSNISNTCHSSFLYLFIERAARRSLLEILVEPVAQSVEPDQTVDRPPGPVELVALLMNQDHLGRNTLLTQTGEHLQGLVHPAAVVGVGVDKQGGSGDIAD